MGCIRRVWNKPPRSQAAGASGRAQGQRGPTHRNTIIGVEVGAGDVGDRGDELVVDFQAAEEGTVVVGVFLYLPGLWTQHRMRMSKCAPRGQPRETWELQLHRQ